MGLFDNLFGKQRDKGAIGEIIEESGDFNRFQVAGGIFGIKLVGVRVEGIVREGGLKNGMQSKVNGKFFSIKRIDSGFKTVSLAQKGEKVSLILASKELDKNDFKEGMTIDFD